jgi:hypothetical protein
MRGRSALQAIALRIQHDLTRRFPLATVRVEDAPHGGYRLAVRDVDQSWGEVDSNVDDDALSPSEVEAEAARLAVDIFDNLWPDELTDPWPLCPAHGDHPLDPAMAEGKASWSCRLDPSVTVTIGELP